MVRNARLVALFVSVVVLANCILVGLNVWGVAHTPGARVMGMATWPLLFVSYIVYRWCREAGSRQQARETRLKYGQVPD